MSGTCPRGHRLGLSEFSTDGMGNTVLDCQACKREANRPSPFLPGPRPACPLRGALTSGPVCQDAFERAYAGHRFPAPFSRAVLLKVVATGDRAMIPAIVGPFLLTGRAMPGERCIGCSLTPQAAAEVRQTYATTLHPEVDDALVRAHARGELDSYRGASDPQELNDAEQAFESLLQSGDFFDDDIDGLGQPLREAV